MSNWVLQPRNAHISGFLGDFQTRAWKPLCMCEQLSLTPHPCEVPGSNLWVSKLRLKEDWRPVQGSWATEYLDGELGF